MLMNLPFDTETMLAGLRPWIECESPTYDATAVNRMMDLAAYDLALERWSELANRREQATTLHNRGQTYLALGETDQAIAAKLTLAKLPVQRSCKKPEFKV